VENRFSNYPTSPEITTLSIIREYHMALGRQPHWALTLWISDACKKVQALIRRTRRSGVFETITLRVLRRAKSFAAAMTIS